MHTNTFCKYRKKLLASPHVHLVDEDVAFFSKKIILCAKGGDFKKGALDSDFMFVNIEPYKSKKCVPY